MPRFSLHFAEPERQDERGATRGPRRGAVLIVSLGALAGLVLLIIAPASMSEGAGSGASPASRHVIHTRMATAAPGRKRPSAHSPKADTATWTESSAPEADSSEIP